MKRRTMLLSSLLLVAIIFTVTRLTALANGTLTAPAGSGAVGLTYTATVPAGSTAGDQTLCQDGVNAHFYTLTLTGIGDEGSSTYYDEKQGRLEVRIDWQPVTAGNPTAQDIALYLVLNDTTIATSDGGEATEYVAVNNPYDGDYVIVACAFAVALPQEFRGLVGYSVSGPEVITEPELGDGGYEFSPIILVDPQRDVAEPSLRVDNNGLVYACGPFGASRAAEYAQRSSDDGDTFRVLGTPPEGRIATGGGGDCELAVGTEPNENGQYTLSYTGLEALANFSHSSSRDGGGSFIGTSAAVTFAGVDRQWMEGIYEDTVYLGYNAIAAGYQVVRSDDGGLTYTNPPVTAVSDLFRPGPIRIDGEASRNPVADNEIVYFTFTRSDSVWIARSYDRGVTWTEHVVATGFNPNNIFSSLALDTAGNLYVAWTEKGTFHTYYAYSLRPTDNSAGAGDTWSQKRLVNRLPVLSTAMPWIEAGDPGRISISYYGSESEGNIEVGTFDGYWHIYIAATPNALDDVDENGNIPFGQVQVTTHPVHWDSICLSGLGCNLSTPEGDRTLLDFFQNRVDKHGRLHVVYNQSNKIPGQPLGRIALVSYSKQIAGPSLFEGMSIPADSRSVAGDAQIDPEGDSQFPISIFGPTAPTPNDIPALDILNLELRPILTDEVGEFEIELTLKDLSEAALNEALTDMNSGSLIYAVRFFSGTEGQAAVATYDTVNGWRFGFSDMVFANANGSKLQTYTGASAPLTGSADGNTLRMQVPPSQLEALDLPDLSAEEYTDPVRRTATLGDVLYSVTAFTFGNTNADPTLQEYLNQADSTYPFDYTIVSVPTAVQLSGQSEVIAADEQAVLFPPVLALLGGALLLFTVGVTVYTTWQRRSA